MDPLGELMVQERSLISHTQKRAEQSMAARQANSSSAAVSNRQD